MTAVENYHSVNIFTQYSALTLRQVDVRGVLLTSTAQQVKCTMDVVHASKVRLLCIAEVIIHQNFPNTFRTPPLAST